jgi:hypothetical protein
MHGCGLVALALVAACGPDWDVLDPSLGGGETGGASASSTGVGASGAGSSTSSNTGSGGCEPDDMNDCTSDDCQGGVAVHDPLPTGTACESSGGHICDGSGQCVECNTLADCSIGCQTAKMCKMHSCFQTSNKAAGATCSEDGGKVCDGSGDCVDCINNTNCTAPETCGGGGTPNVCGCTPTASCATLALTCGSGSDGCGMTLDCDDGIENGTETDVDCGGGVGCATKCAQGDTCLTGTDCTGGICADGFCCDAACTAQCKACSVSGSEGKCVNIPKLGTDTTGTTCSGVNACDGAGICKKANGQPCAAAGECASGTCAGLCV